MPMHTKGTNTRGMVSSGQTRGPLPNVAGILGTLHNIFALLLEGLASKTAVVSSRVFSRDLNGPPEGEVMG